MSETAATIYKLIYVDNYITRGDIAKKVGVSVTAVQKYKKKNPQETDIQNPADFVKWSRWDSNPRPSEPESDALFS